MSDRRALAVLTTGRQDYGILRSTLLRLHADARFDLHVWAGGMHLSAAHGMTVAALEADGLPIAERLDFLRAEGGAGDSDVPETAGACARALSSVAGAIARTRPDALLLLGDRYETLAAGVAATLAGVPIVHLHGGEETEGAIDNAMRHALTKLAHLHLVSHAEHARRVLQMGEPSETVVVVGAPGLDNLLRSDLPDREELAASLGCALEPPVVVVTLHPTTLGGDPAAEAAALGAAMAAVPATYVVCQPNADAGAGAIRDYWSAWVRGRERAVLVDALGERRWWGLLRVADAVAGNSSSGILEAPAAGLPSINVGDRQCGRLRSAHVRDVAAEASAIGTALREAVAPGARNRLRGVPGVHPGGPAAPRIVEAIAGWRPARPPRKRFADADCAGGSR